MALSLLISRGKRPVLLGVLVLGSFLLLACGSSGDDAARQRDLTDAARRLSEYSSLTYKTAQSISQIPQQLNTPKRAIARARRLASEASQLNRDVIALQAPAPALRRSRDDLADATRKLAGAARGVRKAAEEVRGGSRDPNLRGAKRNLKRATVLMDRSYSTLDAFVSENLGGRVTLAMAPRVALAKVKLPPLPDLAFNFTDSGQGTVGDWSPSLTEQATIQAAERVFGPPAISCQQQRQGTSGVNEWTKLGLEVMQADFGGGDPCAGPVQVAEVSGPAAFQWVTNAGLRVGDSEAKVRSLYPGTQKSIYATGVNENGLVLASTAGNVPREFVALIAAGKVSALRMWIGGAGE